MRRPRIGYPGDGSILIEWTNRTWRFGLTLEPKRWQSGWYFVWRTPARTHGYSGRIFGLGLLRPLFAESNKEEG